MKVTRPVSFVLKIFTIVLLFLSVASFIKALDETSIYKILGILVSLTQFIAMIVVYRISRLTNECPTCGKRMKVNAFICPRCNTDIRYLNINKG